MAAGARRRDVVRPSREAFGDRIGSRQPGRRSGTRDTGRAVSPASRPCAQAPAHASVNGCPSASLRRVPAATHTRKTRDCMASGTVVRAISVAIGATIGAGFKTAIDQAGSIHAPARVRRVNLYSTLLVERFNPRTRKGATIHLQVEQKLRAVSIHAPARVRLETSRPQSSRSSFNPRTRKGATRPHRARGAGRCFNPRTRKGATSEYGPTLVLHGVSIHAPARVRPGPRKTRCSRRSFQSTHPQGCDACR